MPEVRDHGWSKVGPRREQRPRATQEQLPNPALRATFSQKEKEAKTATAELVVESGTPEDIAQAAVNAQAVGQDTILGAGDIDEALEATAAVEQASATLQVDTTGLNNVAAGVEEGIAASETYEAEGAAEAAEAEVKAGEASAAAAQKAAEKEQLAAEKAQAVAVVGPAIVLFLFS